MNQQIIEYLQQNKDKYPKEDLIEQLKKAGYEEAEINKAVDFVYYKKNTQKTKKTDVIVGVVVGAFLLIVSMEVFSQIVYTLSAVSTQGLDAQNLISFIIWILVSPVVLFFIFFMIRKWKVEIFLSSIFVYILSGLCFLGIAMLFGLSAMKWDNLSSEIVALLITILETATALVFTKWVFKKRKLNSFFWLMFFGGVGISLVFMWMTSMVLYEIII